MDLRQLAAVVAVAEHGSFSAAADALHTVQSNVSTHVARLERELGAVLIDRSAGRLTEEGEAVVARARRIRAELDAIVADVAALHHEVVGTVRLGAIGTTARWLVPALLAEVGSRHPKVRMFVIEATTTTLEPQLASGALDLAIVNLPIPAPDIAAEPLFDEDLLLVVPSEHPLAGKERVAMSDLDGLELLLPAPGTSFRTEIDTACATAGVSVRPRAELDGVRLMASLTMEGHGPAILPATAIPLWLAGNWRALPVDGLPRRCVGLALRRRGLPAAPARALIDVIRDVVSADADTQPGLHITA